MKKLLLLMGLAAIGPTFGMVESVNYYGRLVPMNGRTFNGQTPLTMTFRLYTQAEGGAPIWGRRYPVVPAKDGTFRVNLADTEGTGIGAANNNLATALAISARDGLPIYVGLSPDDTDGSNALEFKPRQRLATVPAAEVAVTAARASRAEMTDLTVGGTLTLKSGTVGDVTVKTPLRASPVFEPGQNATLDCGAGVTVTAGNSYFQPKVHARDYGWRHESGRWVYRCDTPSLLRCWKKSDSSKWGYYVQLVKPGQEVYTNGKGRWCHMETIGAASHE